ncbi:putative signal transducing protein [Adhaeribacter pallidiroseus]|uniref:DUF2007 domain-containing protein n=1 Tax=Adhaeribacter pallidiroseus TaxID=2072847 RepID=A0A369QLB5_9BACT|nr:DUF2007 domain-containing protein [Adhaeribacter pallidiroseus]RDC65723.1 hypothetical protein AHMF7616_04353 [Adhaeribacter pallidiroseus]
MENKLITIATFPDALKAQIMRGRLEAEGIPAFIADEHTITNQPYLYMAYGGVRLQVAEQDRERAQQALQASEPFSVDPAPEHFPDQCPNCHSPKVTETTSINQPSLLSLLRNVLTFRDPQTPVRRFTCANCGYKWIVEN